MLAYGVQYLNELNLKCVLMIILTMILPILGLLFSLENKVSHNSKWKEDVQIGDEINSLFYEQEENITSTAHCACSFCGRLSITVTRCSRCKAAIYCSNTCHVKHWRIFHKYECVEIEGSENQHESPSNGTHFLLTEPENDKYSFSEVEQRKYEGDVYYTEGGENSVEISDETALKCNDGCAVCGNPSSKVCSRCKAIKYCSQTCQHFDWRSGHRFQCLVQQANSTEAAIVNQGRPANGNVVNLTNSNEVEDDAHSCSPLRLECFSGNTSSKALIRSSMSQEATNNGQKEVEDQFRSLEEELAKIKDENMSLLSEHDERELRARNSIDRLYSFRKENEQQLFILKHENELMSNAEKQARQRANSLSQRLHCLQIAVESGVEERKKQEEYIHMLQGCSICLANEKNMAFGCGHMTCLECGSKIRKCHVCRRKITSRIRLFPD